MDKKDYLSTLKKTDLRPGRVKVKEHAPKVLMEQDTKSDELQNKIIKWFMANPYPKDNQIAKLADEMGMKEPELENVIYAVLSSVLSEGKSKDFKGTYDPEQSKMGIEVEKEHTTNPLIAEKIAWDHLAEIPDYYTRLKKMESEAGVEESKLFEIFVQSSEIAAMPAGKERDTQILRLGMIAELDAVNLYNKLAELASDKRVSKLMLDVSREEKVHAGEFKTLLEEIDPDFEKTEDEGEKEADDLLGI